MRSLAAMQPATPFAVTRRRRSFGLDAPRPPDVRRIEAVILAWLTAHMPQVFPLRTKDDETAAMPKTASTLVLLLPGGGIAVLRIEVRCDRVGAGTRALANHCAARRIPFSLVADVQAARAALRRLGLEPEEA